MTLGRIAFLGSGETSLAGGRIFESLARLISDPLRVAIMETPAGFELNSALVAGRVGDFFKTRLQNFKPVIDLIPARKRGSAFSPDDPEIIKPLLYANLIFMGPGSPTYAIRQLKDTLAWDVIRARHRLGATLVFASAATISIGAHSLPVYEIYLVKPSDMNCLFPFRNTGSIARFFMMKAPLNRILFFCMQPRGLQNIGPKNIGWHLQN